MARSWSSNKSAETVAEEVVRENSRIETLEKNEAKRRELHAEKLAKRRAALAQKAEKVATYKAERAGRKRLHPAIPALLTSVEFSVIGLAAASLTAAMRSQNLEVLPTHLNETFLDELHAQSENVAVDEAVSMVMAVVGNNLSNAQKANLAQRVFEDVRHCRKLIDDVKDEKRRAQKRVAKTIRLNFQIQSGPAPVFGLPYAVWREITDVWAAKNKIPQRAIFTIDMGLFNGAAPLLMISSGRFQRSAVDESTGMMESPSVALDLELRQKAGLNFPKMLTADIDPGTKFVEKYSRSAERYKDSLKGERILHDHKHAEAIAPLLATPGAAYAVKRWRDHDWGRLLGQRRPIDLTFYEAKSTQTLFGALSHPRFSHLTFSDLDFADLPIERLRALLNDDHAKTQALDGSEELEVDDDN